MVDDKRFCGCAADYLLLDLPAFAGAVEVMVVLLYIMCYL